MRENALLLACLAAGVAAGAAGWAPQRRGVGCRHKKACRAIWRVDRGQALLF